MKLDTEDHVLFFSASGSQLDILSLNHNFLSDDNLEIQKKQENSKHDFKHKTPKPLVFELS